jgi:ubiquinone biosynthesis protein UbiJ
MTASPAWLAAIEALFNRGIAGSAQAAALAERLNATTIRVEVRGIMTVEAGVSGGRLALVARDVAPDVEAGENGERPSTDAADATISGSPLALLQLVRGGTTRRGAAAAAQVRGDAEIADAYRRLFALARPDLEEELARVIGDLPARRLAQFGARSFAWARTVRRTAGANVAEYLQEESRDLVNRAELEEFLRGVDALRDTAERIEARLKRLERAAAGPPA